MKPNVKPNVKRTIDSTFSQMKDKNVFWPDHLDLHIRDLQEHTAWKSEELKG